MCRRGNAVVTAGRETWRTAAIVGAPSGGIRPAQAHDDERLRTTTNTSSSLPKPCVAGSNPAGGSCARPPSQRLPRLFGLPTQSGPARVLPIVGGATGGGGRGAFGWTGVPANVCYQIGPCWGGASI